MRSASTILRGAILTGALALAAPATAFATSGTGEHTPLHLSASTAQHTSSSVSGGSILRTIVALVIVIGLIYGIARVLKKVKGGGQRASGDGLEHLATLPLAQGRSVALVRSGSDVVLVGLSESGVTPIKVYSESEALMNGIALPPAEHSGPALIEATAGSRRAASTGQTFLDILRRMTVRV
jgi:flagellar protein FliO/FliZ